MFYCFIFLFYLCETKYITKHGQDMLFKQRLNEPLILISLLFLCTNEEENCCSLTPCCFNDIPVMTNLIGHLSSWLSALTNSITIIYSNDWTNTYLIKEGCTNIIPITNKEICDALAFI